MSANLEYLKFQHDRQLQARQQQDIAKSREILIRQLQGNNRLGALEQLNNVAPQGLNLQSLPGLVNALTPQDMSKLSANMLSPQQPQVTGKVAQYLQAQEQNLIPGMSFQEFAGLGSDQINIGGESDFKVPTGFKRDPNDPGAVVPIPGGPKDVSLTEAAGKTQMLRVAQSQLLNIQELLFDKNGTPNYKNISNASVNTPRTDGRRLRASMEVGIQAITRMETGAAMPPSEVDNTRKRFQPSPLDDQATVQLKWEMFQDFLNGTLKLIDPSGRFDAERFETELLLRSQRPPLSSFERY